MRIIWSRDAHLFEKVLHQELLEDKIMDLGDFGMFRLSVKAEGSDTEEEVMANNIKGINGRFTPGKEFKDPSAGRRLRSCRNCIKKMLIS